MSKCGADAQNADSYCTRCGEWLPDLNSLTRPGLFRKRTREEKIRKMRVLEAISDGLALTAAAMIFAVLSGSADTQLLFLSLLCCVIGAFYQIVNSISEAQCKKKIEQSRLKLETMPHKTAEQLGSGESTTLVNPQSVVENTTKHLRSSSEGEAIETGAWPNLKSLIVVHSLMKLLTEFALILICSVLALSSDIDSAPPCGSSMTPEQAFERASAVFVGRVLSIQMRNTPRTRAGSTTLYYEVKLEVEKSWKLVDRREITLTTQNISPTSCGSFNVGEKYLVYADRLNDTFFISGLSRTNRIANAREDLQMLGEGRIRLRSGEFRTYRIFVYGVITFILILLATGLILYRMSKKPFRST